MQMFIIFFINKLTEKETELVKLKIFVAKPLWIHYNFPKKYFDRIRIIKGIYTYSFGTYIFSDILIFIFVVDILIINIFLL